MSYGKACVCTLSELHPSLPRTPDFLNAHLASANTAEQIRQTEGGDQRVDALATVNDCSKSSVTDPVSIGGRFWGRWVIAPGAVHAQPETPVDTWAAEAGS
jgi:hypothetical protein